MASSHATPRWSWFLFGLLVALGLPSGCQKDTPLTPQGDAGPRITRVEAARPVIAPGDSTIIRAWVVRGADPGFPVAGAAVAFGEPFGHESGVFSKLESLTDSQGSAFTVFRAGAADSGLVTVKAALGESAKYIAVRIVPAEEGISLQAATQSGATGLPADGRSQCEVTVTAVEGSAHTPVAGMVLVLAAGDQFEDANGNGIFDQGDHVTAAGDRNANGQWDAEGVLPESVTTGEAGSVSFTYKAGTTVGPVFLRITGGGIFREIRLTQHSLSLDVSVMPDARELLADGVSETPVRVRVQDWSGTGIPGVLVKLVAGEPFTDTGGDGFYTEGEDTFDDINHNGVWDAMGAITSVVTTGNDGSAVATFRAGLAVGNATIRATNTSGSSEALVQLLPVPPAREMVFNFTQSSLYADGVSTCDGSVEVRDLNGTPLAGKLVRLCAGERFADVDADGAFTAGTDRLLDDADGNGAWTAMGTIPAQATTGRDGRAEFTFQAGRTAAQVWIRAAVDGISSDAALTLQPVPLAASISCFADSASLVENSSCHVRAYVYDGAHNSVRDGTIVSFHSDEGLISGGNGDGTAFTSSGVAQVTFTAVPEMGGSGTAEIVAETDGTGGRISCTSAIQLPAQSGEIARLTLASMVPEIAVRGTGGVEQARIRAQGFDAARRAVGAGRPVSFVITQGPGGGEEFVDRGDSLVVLTDASGVAEVVLASGTVSGTVLIRARAAGTSGVSEHTSIGIAAGPPVHLSVGVEHCNVLACGWVDMPNDVVALVSDVYRNPVRDGTAVYFTTSRGMVTGNEGLATSLTERGRAVASWNSDGSCGIITVTASTRGGTLLQAITSFIGSGDPFSLSFISPSTPVISMPADGRATTPIEMLVLDQNGNFVLPERVSMEVSALYGKIQDEKPITADGCNASNAKTRYTTAVLDRDESYTVPDDGIGAVDVVTASAGFGPATAQLRINLQTGSSSAANSTIEIGDILPGLVSLFSVTVKDGWGNPLGGHQLAITATGGAVDSTAVTDSYGQANGLSFTAPETPGSVMIEVHDVDPGYGGMILRKTVTISQQ